jgi:two-component system chemotaxis response regulator CheY
VRQSLPDIICADLPDLEGADWALLAGLHGEFPKVPVVVFSSTADRAVVSEAVSQGAIGFVVKPFTAVQVQATLRRVREILVRQSPASVPVPRQKRRIVIIEPDRAVADQLKTILEGGGYEVAAEAANGLDGLIAVDRESPDLVCLDADLPLVDGLNALNAIKACHPNIRGMLVSAHADRESVTQGIATGATGYLLKPFNPARVLGAVALALNGG